MTKQTKPSRKVKVRNRSVQYFEMLDEYAAFQNRKIKALREIFPEWREFKRPK